MSLRDKQRAKKRKHREFKKQNPDHAAQAERQDDAAALRKSLEHFEAASRYGKGLCRNRRFAGIFVSQFGEEAAKEAIYFYTHPEVIDELRRQIGDLEQGFDVEPNIPLPVMPPASSSIPTEEQPNETLLSKRYRMTIDFTLSIDQLWQADDSDSDEEQFMNAMHTKLLDALQNSPAARERLVKCLFASRLEEEEDLILELLDAPDDFTALQPAVDSLSPDDAKWFYDVNKDGLLFENIGEVWDCLHLSEGDLAVCELPDQQ